MSGTIPDVVAAPEAESKHVHGLDQSLNMSTSSSQSPVLTTGDHIIVLKEKPWLSCPIAVWESFFCKRSNAHLVAAANHRHDHYEWMTVYHA
jgi:hypothetical protein